MENVPPILSYLSAEASKPPIWLVGCRAKATSKGVVVPGSKCHFGSVNVQPDSSPHISTAVSIA